MKKNIYIEFIDAQKEKSAQLDWPRRPQLDCPVHYKYRVPVSLFFISAVAVRAISAQAVAGSSSLVRRFSGKDGRVVR
jgi:hypothetical protein